VTRAAPSDARGAQNRVARANEMPTGRRRHSLGRFLPGFSTAADVGRATTNSGTATLKLTFRAFGGFPGLQTCPHSVFRGSIHNPACLPPHADVHFVMLWAKRARIAGPAAKPR